MKNRFSIHLFVVIMVIFIFQLLPPSATQLKADDIFPTPVDPTPLPTRTPPPIVQPITRAKMATIILNVRIDEKNLWSVVQWQDQQGNWIDVEGWRGQLSNKKTIWWVEQKDWGAGPFRWVVYTKSSQEPLGTSEIFNLPNQFGQILTIYVSVPRQNR